MGAAHLYLLPFAGATQTDKDMDMQKQSNVAHVSSARCSSVCSMYVDARCTVKSLNGLPL